MPQLAKHRLLHCTLPRSWRSGTRLQSVPVVGHESQVPASVTPFLVVQYFSDPHVPQVGKHIALQSAIPLAERPGTISQSAALVLPEHELQVPILGASFVEVQNSLAGQLHS